MKQSRNMSPWSKWLVTTLFVVVLLSACRPADSGPPAKESEEPQATEAEARPMMGPGSGMMARHHAVIPAEYNGLKNPVAAGDDSLGRGAELYAGQCATCHGDEGLGDGPGAAGLDPQPAPLAHTGRMLADDYLFWRIGEGGAMAPFNSAMPGWKASLEETERWDLVNYLRVMSGGQPAPGPLTAQAEAEKRADMLAKATGDGLITEEEATLFDEVHAAMDTLLAGRPMGPGGMMGAGQSDVLAELVAGGSFTEEQIQAFNTIHDRLLAAGLMGE
jgi:mono/diheme cytochrome c family protein